MKVLKRNDVSNEVFPFTAVCNECGSELEVDKEDIYIGRLGAALFKCPVCGGEIMLCNYGITDLDIDLTVDNMIFPDHYCHFKAASNDKIDNEDLRKQIRKLIELLRNNPDYLYALSMGTNFAIIIHNDPGDGFYNITIANGYYNTEIPYTNIDRAINWEGDKET